MVLPIFIIILVIKTMKIWDNIMHIMLHLLWISIGVDVSTMTYEFYGELAQGSAFSAHKFKKYSRFVIVQIGLETGFISPNNS